MASEQAAAPAEDQAPERAVLAQPGVRYTTGDPAHRYAVYNEQSGRPEAGVQHGIPAGAIRKLTRNVAPSGGGPGLPPGAIPALHVPAWCQLIDDWPDKAEHPTRDVWATSDCGAQALAMCLYACRGVELPEGLVRQYISDCVGGGMTQGFTTAADLVAYLRSPHVNMPGAHALDEGWPAIRPALELELAANRPVILLGHWYVGFLHWEVAVGYDGVNGLVTNDPWDGHQKRTAWTDYSQRVNTGIAVCMGPGERVRY